MGADGEVAAGRDDGGEAGYAGGIGRGVAAGAEEECAAAEG
ncbi:hypothetical protein [Herbihabitans rhizosphaerae]|nr:hypothetical protein [Herbihabitans rhizosphaerae]